MVGEIIRLTWKKIFRTNIISVVIISIYLIYSFYLTILAKSPEQGAGSMGGVFALLAVLLSGGLIRDEFESKQIEPFLVRIKISDIFWGKFLAVIILILVPSILIGAASFFGLILNNELSTTGLILKILGRGLVITIYLAAVGFFLASQLKGVMNFVAIIVIQTFALYFSEKIFRAAELAESGQLDKLSLKSALLLIFVPSQAKMLGWQVALLLPVTVAFIIWTFLLFKSMASKNNLVFTRSDSPGNPLAKISGLRMTYREGFLRRKSKEALAGVDFSINPGKLTGFLGPNGAGKTTTLRIMLSFLKPDSGKVEFLTNEEKPEAKKKYKIGYLPETASLYPFLTVQETFYLMARNEGLSQEEARELSFRLAAKLGLSEYLNRRVANLSKGTRQKVAFGLATIGRPDFLLFDEPYTGLDPIIMFEIRNLILELKEKGCTIFLSSHLLSEVERVCDEVVLIDKGKIVCAGEIGKLKTAARVWQAIKKDSELAGQLSRLLGVEVKKESLGFFSRINLEPLLQNEALSAALKQIPAPNVEKIFLESIGQTTSD